MRKNILTYLVILIASIILSLPLVKPGLYVIHDDQQIARLFVFDQALKFGQFPVRWVEGLGFGFGYPLFVFYPPFVYILGEIFHVFGFGFVNSIKLVFFVSIFASGLSMHIFAKEFWGRLTAVIAALFYMFIPYRALDIYVRGALAESFSFVWLPLILWSFYKLISTNKIAYVYLSATFLALLMITHNLIFLPFMLILPFYLLFLFLNSKDKRLLTSHFSLLILLAAGLSAFFWIPALLEKKFTIVDQLLLVNLANYNIHFVYPWQLWNWPWGFGGSAAGLADGISFKIGKLHILVSLAVFIFSVIILLKNSRNKKFSTLNSQFSILIFALFILSAFMTTFYSKFIWDLIQPLGYLQFPWRFLTFTALFSSFLAGGLIYYLRLPILKLLASLILIILLIIPNLKLFKPQTYRPNLTDRIATSKDIINWEISESSFEYLPKGVPMYVGPLGTNLVKIDKGDIPKQRVEILSGTAALENLKTETSKVTFSIDAKEKTKVQINNFNFPGWIAKIDQSKVTIDDNNRLKLISLTIPEGVHQVIVEFKNTPVRFMANMISFLSVILITFLIFKKWQIPSIH